MQRVIFFDEDFGKLPVLLQTMIFNRGDFVVGPHGANLANLIFMRHGTNLLEYIPGQTGNMCYHSAAVRLGIRYHMHVNLKVDQRSPHTIHIDEILAHFEDVLGTE